MKKTKTNSPVRETIHDKYQGCFYDFSVRKTKDSHWEILDEVYLSFDKKNKISGAKYDFSDAIRILGNSFGSREEAIKSGKEVIENYILRNLCPDCLTIRLLVDLKEKSGSFGIENVKCQRCDRKFWRPTKDERLIKLYKDGR